MNAAVRRVLEDGFFWQWTTDRLEQALALLKADSDRLVQGTTTVPPPLQAVSDWPCQKMCFVAFCSVGDPDTATVGDAEMAFAHAVYAADDALGMPAASRTLLNAIDDTPKTELYPFLIEVLKKEIRLRRRLPAVETSVSLSFGDYCMCFCCGVTVGVLLNLAGYFTSVLSAEAVVWNVTLAIAGLLLVFAAVLFWRWSGGEE